MKKYSIISNKKRSELIERVVTKGESISKVAKQIRMKLPSAKSIIRTFKKSGKVFDKKILISRKINYKKTDLSETDHQRGLSSQTEEKLEINKAFEKALKRRETRAKYSFKTRRNK